MERCQFTDRRRVGHSTKGQVKEDINCFFLFSQIGYEHIDGHFIQGYYIGVHQAIIFLIFCSHYLSYVQNKLREAIFFIKINQLINYFLSFRPGRGPCLGVSVLSWKLKTLGLAQRGSCCCCGDWQHRTLSVINWSAQVFSAKKIFNGKTFRQYLEITARGLDKSQAHKSECLPHPS